MWLFLLLSAKHCRGDDMGFFDLFSRNYYQEMTKAVNDWWSSIFKPSSFYDKIDLDLTVHLCGSEEVIEKKASELAGHKIDYPGTAGLALYDQQGKPHIFILSTEIGFANREINYFSAGHELAHIIDMRNERRGDRTVDYVNPDNDRR